MFYGVVLTKAELFQVAKALGVYMEEDKDLYPYDISGELERLLTDFGSFYIPIERESKQAIQNSLRSFDEDMPQTVVDLIIELCGELPVEDSICRMIV